MGRRVPTHGLENAMTPREPTEAMRETAMRLLRSVRSSDVLVDYFARALMEQDAAARRALVEEIAVALLRRFPNQIGEDAVRVVRALTPEPPSEKENEGG